MIICKIDILNVQLVKIVDTNLLSAKSIQCCVYQAGKTLHTEAAAQTCSVKKRVLRNFAKFTGKYLCRSLFFNKAAGLRAATSFKKRLWHRCFSVNFVKFLRTPFLQNTSRRLLLYRKILYSMLSKFVWDNIAKENYLCNIGPERATMILKENNLHNFVLVCLGQDCTKQWPAHCRNSHQRCSIKKDVLKNFAIFTGKHLCRSFFLTKLQAFRAATLLKRNSTTDALE